MANVTQQRSRIGFLEIGISLLTLFTAGAHIYLSTHPDESLRFLFLLNGMGYLALLATFLLPQFARFHDAIRWVLLGYTVLTIVLWLLVGSPAEGQIDPFDITVKACEFLLIIFLFLDSKRNPLERAD